MYIYIYIYIYIHTRDHKSSTARKMLKSHRLTEIKWDPKRLRGNLGTS